MATVDGGKRVVEGWLTKGELAAEFKVSTRMIERLGIPPSQRVGAQNRYRLSEVRAFLRGGRTEEGASVVELHDRHRDDRPGAA